MLLLDPLGIGLVDAVQEVGNPGQFVLHGAHLEFWITLKDAAEGHVAGYPRSPTMGTPLGGRRDGRGGCAGYLRWSANRIAVPICTLFGVRNETGKLALAPPGIWVNGSSMQEPPT